MHTQRKPSDVGRFLLAELRPKGRLLTPFNLVSIPVIALGAVLLVIRFARGLGSVTNLNQEYPWGLWIGFDVITGVAFAAGAYVVTFIVYILNMKKYHAIVRATILNGLLGYLFYAGALLLDLGRPWNVINPIIGNSFGVSSVLFLVAWHFLLYMIAEAIEFSPAVAEWLGWRRLRKLMASLTLGAVILGITLSTLHQAGLGALYLMAKGKLHPLWYSEFIPLLFFVSSIFAGLSMVIFEGSISQRVFGHRLSSDHRASHDGILLGLARICAGAMFVYLFLQTLVFVHGQRWEYLATGWGAWYLLELVGFVLVPLVLFARASLLGRPRAVRLAAALTLAGIVLNRLNVTIIGFKWYEAARYVPSWMEVAVTLAVVLAEIWAFRWIVNRMPVLGESPAWATDEDRAEPSAPPLRLVKEA
ncbi:MAG TPA: Ni/Fe-hydrogenase cytochrome b subunit [Candidatus Polarisedimenticolaceae bacterium]|nr:Ni/Fe-hydrogenase cytochrome b subunit [Candidatus Polarisedimenticolaceae bacterium]